MVEIAPTPLIQLQLALQPGYDAETDDQDPGPALAQKLRLIADTLEEQVNILPYPGNEEWVDEQTEVYDPEGPWIGSYTLTAQH